MPAATVNGCTCQDLARWRPTTRLAPLVAVLLATGACSPRDKAPPLVPLAEVSADGACTIPSDAYLRARLRGAVNADIEWNDAQMTCSGGPRPNSEGLRVSIAGDSAQGRLRFIFGMPAAPGQAEAAAVPTNLTVILEGKQRMFATAGEDRCTTDALRQRAVPPRGYRIEAHGFCTDPAVAMSGSDAEALLVSTFDFVSRIQAHEERESYRSSMPGASTTGAPPVVAPSTLLPRSTAAP
jgi:hypothetical protein